MKQKHNGGFSLIETVVAIAILGLITVPCTSGLLMSIRLNEKAQQMMQAQLAVSSAVETLMAEGIKGDSDYYKERFPGMEFLIIPEEKANKAYVKVTINVKDMDDVKVTTFIRKAPGGEGATGS